MSTCKADARRGITFTLDCDCPPCKSKILGITGLFATLIILLAILVAVLSYPSFNFANQFISDLGMATVSPAHALFNGAFIVGGIGLMIFSGMLGLIITRNRGMGLIVSISGIIAGFGTILVGLYPQDIHAGVHIASASLVFLGMWLSSFFYAIIIARQKKGSRNFPPVFGVICLFIASLMCAFGMIAIVEGYIVDIALRPDVYNYSMIEWVSVMSYLGFVLSISIYELY